MDWLALLFRLIHVPAAIVWAGGAIYLSLYIEPTIAKLGPDADKFVEEVFVKRRTSMFFAIAATLTVVGGAYLYVRDAGGLQLWTSTTGIVFTIGAIAGILAWLSGAVILGPTVKRVGSLAAQMKAAGGLPSADLIGQMAAAQARLKLISQVDTVLIIVAVLTMATARYFV